METLDTKRKNTKYDTKTNIFAGKIWINTTDSLGTL